MDTKNKNHFISPLCLLEGLENERQDYLKVADRRLLELEKVSALQHSRIVHLEEATKSQQDHIDADVHRHNKHHFESIREEDRIRNQLSAFKSDVNNWRLVGLVGLGGWAVAALLLAFVFMYNSDITIVF